MTLRKRDDNAACRNNKYSKSLKNSLHSSNPQRFFGKPITKCLPLAIKLTIKYVYRGADESLSRPDWKKQFKGRYFSSDAEVIAAAENCSDGKPSEIILSGLQNLEFGHCGLLSSWSG